jgi:hypothetical protein
MSDEKAGVVESAPPPAKPDDAQPAPSPALERAKEFGGREGPEPTRYGDWEVKGIASDF